jgi:hypothetical protein
MRSNRLSRDALICSPRHCPISNGIFRKNSVEYGVEMEWRMSAQTLPTCNCEQSPKNTH